ncbi:prepilin-type N-terminal cleavage/methylation domain-containing protein [Corallococcus macrosporus]|uniref:Type 4 pilus biogenesis operon protein n=1 Tax=Myxococcus fulvus (strain ATCC BAA-855 / HW-1) TaxID=483219 RepID=F8CA38_MYXFH|nr:type II secretion system protein [Corallococcus macrosporus]AEI63288.1 type 4 pilus biogenesis operon protein [Corallococcus macrosporus]
MKPLKTRQHSRGITLLEVLATMAILLLGISAAMLVVSQTSYSNRRSLTATQAQIIAEQAMENITLMGCAVDPPCSNLVGQDVNYTLFQTAAGALSNEPPDNDEVVAREFQVAVDVDVPSQLGTIEAGSVVPLNLARDLVAEQPGSVGNIAHVRVTVSWREPERADRHVVVLQTRMAP